MNKTDEINLSEQTKFRLNQIRKIKNCFHQEINQIKLCSKRLSKYVLIVWSATTGGVTIISFTSVARAPVGTASASFTLIFSQTIGIIKTLLRITRKKREKAW